MCGIVGVASNAMSQQKERFFQQLLMLDTQRGPHSTGVISVGNHWVDHELRYVKDTGTPWELFTTKEFETMFRKVHKVLIGHNRWATKGAINGDNAHPFEHGDLCGVHNGTLRNQHVLDDHKNFDVDSDNLYYHMSKNCLKSTISKVDGAYALVWIDTKNDTLNMLRNKDRPLFLSSFVDDPTSIIWASEEWMIHVASIKCDLKITKPAMLEAHKLHQWELTEGGIVPTLEHKTHIPPYVAPTYTYKYSTPANTKYTPPAKKGVSGKIEKKEVIFEVHGESKLNGTYNYTYGKVVEGPEKGEIVRIYATGTSKLYTQLRKDLMEADTYFMGESAYSYEDKFLELRINNVSTLTIKPMPDGWEPTYDEDIIINSVVYTHEEALKRVDCGCCYCGVVPKLDEINDCVFADSLGTKDFLCPECAEDNNVVELMSGVMMI